MVGLLKINLFSLYFKIVSGLFLVLFLYITLLIVLQNTTKQNNEIIAPRLNFDHNPNTPEWCENWNGVDLELFLPVPANQQGVDECQTYILPSLAFFWPLDARFQLLMITDAEADNVSKWISAYSNLSEAYGMNSNGAKTRISQNHLKIPLERGWHRQQWLMFWADNFTNSDFVGFLDSDTVFITRVTYPDLFAEDGKPIIRAIFGKPHDPSWWPRSAISSMIAIGHPEVVNCMSYFPVILKTSHLSAMREHIRKTLRKNTFDEAFLAIVSQEVYSQFSIMCNFVYYFKHDEYYWTIRERDPNFKGPFAPGQFSNKSAIGQKYFNRQIPSLAIHWNYERFKDEPYALKKALQTGICYSLPPHSPEYAKICSSLTIDRIGALNPYEWMFEGYEFTWNITELQKIHRKRLALNEKCPVTWNIPLIFDLLL